jgi:hypothetical protein
MLGSVFLGDPRQRLIASSSQSPQSSSFFHQPPHITPELALQLRIRWLEALLLGVSEIGGRDEQQQQTDKADTKKPKAEEKKARVAIPRRPLKPGDEKGKEKEEKEEKEDGDGDETDEVDLDDEDLDDQSLIRQASEIQRKLESIVSTNEDLSKFVADCKSHPSLTFLILLKTTIIMRF